MKIKIKSESNFSKIKKNQFLKNFYLNYIFLLLLFLFCLCRTIKEVEQTLTTIRKELVDKHNNNNNNTTILRANNQSLKKVEIKHN